MTPRAALLDLVAAWVGARDGAAVRVSETDVRQWPAEAVAALKAHRLLVRARPARTVVCPGCEADCVMPVQTIPAGPRAAARFIVCDKRSDINRVALTTAHVDQWAPSAMPRPSPGLSSRNWACAGAGTGSTSQGRGPSGSPPGTRGTRCWACARTGT